MNLVLSVFVLSGCGDKNDKEECDQKGTDWVWDATKKECVAKATTKEDCDKKGTNWVWDEVNKKCNQSTAGLSDKEKCEAKGTGWTWNEDKATNAGEEYKKCTKDLSMDCTDPAKPLVKTASPLECVAPYYTIVNHSTVDISYGSDSLRFNLGKCKSMSKEAFDDLNPFSIMEVNEGIICSSRENVGKPCPSAGGIYGVVKRLRSLGPLESHEMPIITEYQTVKELRNIGCFKYIIEAEGPL